MNSKLKPVLLILGLLAALLIISQLVMGLMLASGSSSMGLAKLQKMHQHTGYLTVTTVLIYIGFSLSTIAGLPTRPKG